MRFYRSDGMLLILLALFVATGVACGRKPPAQKVAVKINNYELTAREFDGLFSELEVEQDTAEARENFLENLVMRKLMLQAAQREGLDQEKDFLKSIQNFWEQSLLKMVVDRKMKEVAGDVVATDREIEAAYEKWKLQNLDTPKVLDEVRDVIEWQLVREKQSLALRDWIEGLRKEADVKIDRHAIGIE